MACKSGLSPYANYAREMERLCLHVSRNRAGTGDWRAGKITRRLCVLLGVAVIAIPVGIGLRAHLTARLWANWERRRDRLYGYETAFEFCRDSGKPIPGSLQEIMAMYNSARGKESRLSLCWPIPEYRPAGNLRGGPYLVLVDRPEYWYDSMSLVAFADPSGEFVRVEWLTREQLGRALREDDQRRAAALERPTPVLAPPSTPESRRSPTTTLTTSCLRKD